MYSYKTNTGREAPPIEPFPPFKNGELPPTDGWRFTLPETLDAAEVGELRYELDECKARIERLEASLKPRQGEDTPPQPIKLREILELVATTFDIGEQVFLGQRRDRDTARARQVFCYLALQYSNTSSIRIGKFLKKDHSTVLYSGDTVADIINAEHHRYDERLAKCVGELKTILSARSSAQAERAA